MVKKIAKKHFVEKLVNSKSVFCGSFFGYNDEKVVKIMEEVGFVPVEGRNCRTVQESKSNHIEFSDGSRLYFNQDGKKEYFGYKNNEGTEFVIQRTETFDSFDNKNKQHYIIYAIAPVT